MTNQADTISQTDYWLCDKLYFRIGDKQNKLLCSKSLSYKLQLRCQQVLDALCDQPKGKQNSHCVTNYAGTTWQTKQSLCDKLSVRIGDKQNRLLCKKSLYYQLQVRCQQVKDALCHQPKG